MLTVLIIIIAFLWFFGYVNISGVSMPDITLFTINNHPITLVNIVVLFMVSAAISILPSPFREIAGVFTLLWILAVIGIISLAGFSLPAIFLFAVLIGLIASLFNRASVV